MTILTFILMAYILFLMACKPASVLSGKSSRSLDHAYCTIRSNRGSTDFQTIGDHSRCELIAANLPFRNL